MQKTSSIILELRRICYNPLRENLRLLFSVFAAGIFAYGFLIVDFNIGLDEEIIFDLDAYKFSYALASLNRWTGFIYAYALLPVMYYPVISSVLSIFFISLGYALFVSNLKNLSFAAKFIFCGVAVSFPTLGELLEFNFNSAQDCCSVAVTILA